MLPIRQATIIGITESKLTILHYLKINFPGYDTLQYDKNRNGGGAACYIWIYVLIKEL